VFEVEGVSQQDAEKEYAEGELPPYPTLIDPTTGKPGPVRHRLEVITDDSGQAAVDIQLGTQNGDWRIEASAFRGEKKKPIKEHFRVASGVQKLTDNLEAGVGKTVELKLRLVERDENGDLAPLDKRVVLFRLVSEPRGQSERAELDNRKADTDSDGIRKGLDLTLGDRSGTYRVLAEIEPGSDADGDDAPIRGVVFTVKAIDWMRLALAFCSGALLFLVGVRVLANGFLIVLSPRIPLVTGPLATNRLLGYFGGVLSGAAFQSASTVSSYLTSFTNGGLLTARGALGLLLGASLGASLLPQALALDLDFLVAPLLGLGLLFLLFRRSSGLSHWAGVCLGAGLVIASWTILGDAMDLLALSDRFREEVLPTQADLATGYGAMLQSFGIYLLVAIVLGFLLRTSNLIVILSILLAEHGVILPVIAVPLIIGSNLGSGINSLLRASFKIREARRVGLLALIVNAVGAFVFVVLSLIPLDGSPLALWVVELATPGPLFHPLPENLDHHLAMLHTLLNLTGGLLVLVASPWILAWTEKLLPVSKSTEDVKPFRLDENLISVPSLALRQTTEEVVYITQLCQKSVAEAFDAFRYGNLDLAEQVVRRGEVIQTIHIETSRYLVLVSENQVSIRDASTIEALQCAVGMLSRIGEDAEMLREMTGRRVEDKIEGIDEIDRDLSDVYDLIMAQFDNVVNLLHRREGRGEDSAARTIERLAKFRSRFETQWRQRVEHAASAPATEAGEHSRVHVQAAVYQDTFNLLFQIAGHLAHIAERIRILAPQRL